MSDLTYLKQGIFTAFFPQTKAGESAWAELAKATENTGKVFTAHLPQVLKQLREAGYSVAKAKKARPGDLDKILEEVLNDPFWDTLEAK
jgi:hypothetical protein